MEKKKDKIIICVNCERKFKREKDEEDEIEFIPIEEPVAKEIPKVSASKQDAKLKADEEELQKKQEKLSQITKKMGEKLLLGWGMYLFYSELLIYFI